MIKTLKNKLIKPILSIIETPLNPLLEILNVCAQLCNFHLIGVLVEK